MCQPLADKFKINHNGGFMKTIAVISIVFLSFMELHAQNQIKQGVYTLSGTLNYYSTSVKDNSSGFDQTDVMLTPSGSYFIIDQAELSFGMEYERSISKSNNSSQEWKYTRPGLELGVKFYLPYGNVAPFIGAFGDVSWISFNGQSYSSPLTSYSFTGGLEVFISEAAAIEPSIGYYIYHSTDQHSDSENQFRIGIGVKYFIL
jgi:hypothetical protein